MNPQGVVQGFDGACGPRGCGRREETFELVEEHPVVCPRGSSPRLHVEFFGKEAESYSIALAAKEFHEGRRGKDRELELAHSVVVERHPIGIGHAARHVQEWQRLHEG